MDRPILFNAEMVSALLSGKKTQTRRVVKQQNDLDFLGGGVDDGDDIGVRIKWDRCADDDGKLGRAEWLAFCADYPEEGCIEIGSGYGQPGDHLLPHRIRGESRITLELTNVRVERLREISEEDAIAEGVDAASMDDVPRQTTWSRRQDFSQLWDSINTKHPWQSNPWVWVLTFKLCLANEGEIAL